MSDNDTSPVGSSVADFFSDTGDLEEIEARAQKRVLAWKLEQEMKKKGITQTALADRMKTSRT